MRTKRGAVTAADDRLPQRVRALAQAAELSEGRVESGAVGEAQRVVTQVDRRLALSGEATVVALAGATGSGKSSLFNVLSGTSLAAVGVRRPTTATPLAARWGDLAAGELLDWLEVNRRHGVHPEEADGLAGLVLLDLPDHDSTELSHQLEVDRLVQLVDVMVWVVDPQKYADAALHDRYLKPLASHADVMVVVLNQADRLSEADRERCLTDLRRLLASEGLPGVPVLAASAETGYGVAELRGHLARQVADKQAAARRLAADVGRAADQLAEATGPGGTPTLTRTSIDRLNHAVAEAAGVPAVLDAVGQAWRRRGALATGWPLLAWLAKFRPDPLRRLHLDRGTGRPELEAPASRSSLPQATGVQQARADSAIRDLADEAGRQLSRGWSDAVKTAARSQSDALADALDRAVSTTDLDLHRHRRWWQLVRVLQWLLIAAIVAGLGWFGLAFLLTYLRLPPLPEVTWWGYPPPLLLIVGGVLAGLIVAGLSRIGVEVGARRRVRAARRALLRGVEQVTNAYVLEPVRAELERYDAAQAALLEARSG
jgi:GTP-binding protein EngB required for normal cell division